MGSPDRNMSMVDIHLRKLLCVYCPEHTGVMGNDRVDRLASKATLTSGLFFSRKSSSVQELETLPAGTKSRKLHHLSLAGETRGKRKRFTIYLFFWKDESIRWLIIIIIIHDFCIALFSGVHKVTALYNILQHFLSEEKMNTNMKKTNIGTVTKATLGKLPRDRMERIWAFPSE